MFKSAPVDGPLRFATFVPCLKIQQDEPKSINWVNLA